MLKNLKIQNYALIQSLDIDFSNGFLTLTGETGAGKSILLGALSLVLGARADLTALQNNNEKCIIEALFDIKLYNLKDFFTQNDLDYEDETLIRREINTSGKSRAFINDTPVNLNHLKDLSSKLIDIHSQHQSLALNNASFQMQVIDAVAKNEALLIEYKAAYRLYKKREKELAVLKEQAQGIAADYEYNLFQFNKLNELNLAEIDIKALEDEMRLLNNAEEIKEHLGICFSTLSEGEVNTLEQLKTVKQSLVKIQNVLPKASEWVDRIESIRIDLKDIAQETEYAAESIEYNPDRTQQIRERLDAVYEALHRHQADDIAHLIDLQEQFEQKVNKHSNIDFELKESEKKLLDATAQLENVGLKLSNKRKKASEPFSKEIIKQLGELGMPYAGFRASVESNSHFQPDGIDKVTFLFSANKNQSEQSISKIASGGEISRLMLSIKAILSESVSLPTIIFDEIDTGVSGEIADKMAGIMGRMAKNMQVVSITHLPQIAAKGNYHYKVFKNEDHRNVQTNIVMLNSEERIDEIARLLSGSKVSKEAVENAKTLIQS